VEKLVREQAVAEIFLILAEFYKYPTESFYNQIASGDVDKYLIALSENAGYQLEFIQFSSQIESCKKLQGEYSRSFLGITSPFAMPVESVYKVWTTNPSAQVPIANSKGYVMGDSALHILHLFEHFQLEVPEEYALTPDHLTILLELYAFLSKERSPNECSIFLKEHFDWLEDFQKELSKVQNITFYLYVIEVLREVIRQEQQCLEKVQ